MSALTIYDCCLDGYHCCVGKRKSRPTVRTWARMVGPEWQVHLPDGEVLRLLRDLTYEEASTLASDYPVYLISFLRPVHVLTGDPAAIRAELDRVDGTRRVDTNSVALFRGGRGSEAVVFERFH